MTTKTRTKTKAKAKTRTTKARAKLVGQKRHFKIKAKVPNDPLLPADPQPVAALAAAPDEVQPEPTPLPEAVQAILAAHPSTRWERIKKWWEGNSGSEYKT